MQLKKIFQVLISLLGWFALMLQFIILVKLFSKEGRNIFAALINFCSFFTVLTNMLIAFSLTIILLKPRSSQTNFFSKTSIQTAIAAYITVVAIVYNLILRNLWFPQGWHKVADEFLHLVIPVLYVVYWLFFVKKGTVKWKSVITWLTYPFVYVCYVFIRGYFTDEYPYPFLDLTHQGIKNVATNSVILFFLFISINVLFVAIDKLAGYYFRSNSSPSV